MRCGIRQCRGLEFGIQERKLCLPSRLLQQRSIPGKPAALRNRMQHRRLGSRRTQSLFARQTRSHPACRRQLAQQQPRSQTPESTGPSHGQNQHPKTGAPSSESSGRSDRWWSGSSTPGCFGRQSHECAHPAATASAAAEATTECDEYGWSATSSPSCSSRWRCAGRDG